MFGLLALAAITFHADFEGGSLGKVDTVSPTHYRLHVLGEVDQDKRNRQASWYYFRIDGARGQDLTLDLVDLPGEYNYKPNKGAIVSETRPFFSVDDKTWTTLESTSYDTAEPHLRLKIRPTADRFWIAHTPPYTTQHLNALLTSLKGNPHLSRQVVGKTVGGRDMPLLTITDRGQVGTKKVIWILFRQHAWESGSSWAGEGAIRFLTSSDPAAVRIRQQAAFKIFPMCDPDGVIRGGVRFNANGYDLNRNWDLVDPKKMPEIAAQRQAILDWVDHGGRADMLLTLHNDEGPEYIGGPPGQEHLPLLERFSKLIEASPVFQQNRKASLAETSTTAGKPGRMSFPQGMYHDRKLPAFLIELRCFLHPELGHEPNIPDRLRFGRDLVQAMASAVQP